MALLLATSDVVNQRASTVNGGGALVRRYVLLQVLLYLTICKAKCCLNWLTQQPTASMQLD